MAANDGGLQTELTILNKQSASTSEAWRDTVQQKFYKQFVDILPAEFNYLASELNRTEATLGAAEMRIMSML